MDRPSPTGPIWTVLGRVNKFRQNGSGYTACCPAHEDRDPSLSIKEGLNGKVLLYCHAGCTLDAICDALGITKADLFDRSAEGYQRQPFRLVDITGRTVARHIRTDRPGDKDYEWERNGRKTLGGLPVESLPLYGLPLLLEAEKGSTVYVCEGEQAAQALIDAGVLAVGTVTGASGTPNGEALAPLRDYTVVLWPDNDQVGREHMERIAAALNMHKPPMWLEWPDAPEKGDAADYFKAGGTVEGLAKLVRPWKAEEAPISETNGTANFSDYLDLVPLSSIEPELIHWLWQGRIPLGKLTVLMGDPGLGKSLLTVSVASIVSNGGMFKDGHRAEQGAVILLTAEDGLADTVRPRLDVAKANVNQVFALRSVREKADDLIGRLFQLANDIALLEQAIMQTGAKLVIMDPLNAYLGGVDSHKAAEVRAVLAPLSAMAERTGVSVLVVHHLNKGTSPNALYRAGGSLDFVAAARSVLGVVPDPNEPERRLLISVKVNIAQRPEGLGYRVKASGIMANAPPIVEWDDEPVNVDPTTAFSGNETGEERGYRTELKDFLEELLRDGPVPADAVKAAIKDRLGGASETTLRKARIELKIKVRRKGYGSAGLWLWELPETIDAPKTPSPSTNDGNGAYGVNEPVKGSIGSIGSIDSIPPSRARKCADCGIETGSPHAARCEPCHARRNQMPDIEVLPL